MARKSKLEKYLNREGYEKALCVKNHPEFVYNLDVLTYIELYQALMLPKENDIG